MTKDTELVAISDGAVNCWNVIDHLQDQCKSITRILDWFHIAMKFKNIGSLKSKEMDKAVWVYRGMHLSPEGQTTVDGDFPLHITADASKA